METLLEVLDIHTYIGGFHILQGVSLKVPSTGVTVLLGRNGAGKTTTIRSILGFTPPREGQILFQGEETVGKNPYAIARLGCGYVPEDRGIFGSLTVEENFKVAAREGVSSMKEGLERVFHLFPDLKKAMRQRAGTLSGGQQQMLAIGRVLIAENKLLLIDEPSSGLAPILVEKVAEALVELKEEIPILLVEQNYHMARLISDYYYIIDQGVSVHEGFMEDLDEDHELKKRFLGVMV